MEATTAPEAAEGLKAQVGCLGAVAAVETLRDTHWKSRNCWTPCHQIVGLKGKSTSIRLCSETGLVLGQSMLLRTQELQLSTLDLPCTKVENTAVAEKAVEEAAETAGAATGRSASKPQKHT